MTETKTYDLTMFGLMYEDELVQDSSQDNETTVATAYDALVMSINRNGQKGNIDLEYMSEISGLSVDTLISKLNGQAIIQNPAFFKSEAAWSKTKGWILLPKYLCGNILQKLMSAKEMNRRFPGCFETQIKLLKSKTPAKLSLEDIHVGLGASWVPTSVYELFIKELFAFTETPKVEYIRELGTWKIEPPKEAKLSVINNYTFGTLRMSGIKITEKTMNASTVKVYDEIPQWKRTSSCERILNESETLAAQEKQNLIIHHFNKWIHEKKAIRRFLEECYNDTFVGYVHSRYNGDFLELCDINPEVKLYPHQKSAIARVVLSEENVLLAHDVGSGKTYEMIVSVHELKRLGLSKKNMIVVPNNIFTSTIEAHRYLYPDDNLFVISPKDFTPDARNEILEKIRDMDFDAIYMAYSSFNMITMSKKYWVNKKMQEIRDLRKAASNTDAYQKRSRINSKADRLEQKLEEYIMSTTPTPWLHFDELGIETLVVDEAHNYKNIPFQSSSDNVVGMHTTGSIKCKEMLEKAHHVKRLIFSTGTPITNSLADLYTLQTYLQPEVLTFREIDSFDNWMQTFAERETHFEVKPDSSDIRPVTRFSSFHNLTELMSMFSCVCDFHYTGENQDALPAFNGYTNIKVEKTAVQAQYIKHLAERSEEIRYHRVDRTQDNPLKITTDGWKCAIDPRLLGLDDPEHGKGKISTCAIKIEDFYNKYPGTCQVVFSDIGTPKSSFNVYDALRAELTAIGIPSKEIAYIHEATTERAKTELFRAINSGIIRVVIGSTEKLGVGVNIQENLIALHHLSVPWRPSDMVQREGRILRRGNKCKEVFILRYFTEGTFDSYSWQLLENKQRFISSFLSGTAVERNLEDIQDLVLSYAEVKALAIGNDLIRKRVETSNKLERVKMAGRQRQKQLLDLSTVIHEAPDKIKKLRERIRLAEADKLFYEKCKESIPNSERLSFGEELKQSLAENASLSQERYFDSYQGFCIYLPANMNPERPYIIIERNGFGRYFVSMDCDKPMGYSKKIDYFLDHFADYIANLHKSIENTEKRRDEAKSDYEKGNMFHEEAEKLRCKLMEIDEELNKIREEKKNESTN